MESPHLDPPVRLLILPFLFVISVPVGAQPGPPKGVDVALVSENSTISACGKFTVGLKIHHHPKFHTYWRNPGIAGVPTEIVWQLPEGFTAGPIQWPYPERTLMAIHPVYGYERDVMLLTEITPPPQIASPEVRLKAAATWMACADGCYPGKADLELVLTVSPNPVKDPAAAGAFANARREIPQTLDGWNAELVSAVDAPEIRLRLTSKLPGDSQGLPGDLYFFSSDGQISSDPPQKLETNKDGSIEIIAPRAAYGPKGKNVLPGVLLSGSPLGKNGARFAGIEPSAKP